MNPQNFLIDQLSEFHPEGCDVTLTMFPLDEELKVVTLRFPKEPVVIVPPTYPEHTSKNCWKLANIGEVCQPA